MTTHNALQIKLNGQLYELPSDLSIAGMLTKLGVDPSKIAVERNLVIVPRSMLDEIQVEDGDLFEVVHFVGGG